MHRGLSEAERQRAAQGARRERKPDESHTNDTGGLNAVCKEAATSELPGRRSEHLGELSDWPPPTGRGPAGGCRLLGHHVVD